MEAEYYTTISYSYIIGKTLENEEGIYGDIEEYPIDEAIMNAIKKDYIDIKTYEETQVFVG